ncbi:MAG: hypothetical protein KYX69_09290 [Sphingomonas sp.]|uniref:hypothetical protein n=1 Tax=Sphingomonas sp. TaxID=28214 RepID=UPI002620C2BC|nr:hypothetical protein [Sphingomonas sp.]MDK2767899.1 hypothetical protein [Sphingomonas sp.]
MKKWHGWTHSQKDTRALLSDAHRKRFAEGKRDNAAIKKRARRLLDVADPIRAELVDRALWKKSIAYTRRLRQRQAREMDRDLRRVGAAIRRSERDLKLQRSRVGRSFPDFEFDVVAASPAKQVRSKRDLIFEWIPRGFTSGGSRAFKKAGSPRINARLAKWRDGEFGDKVVYIEREDALEQVAGNVISNMGDAQSDRIDCADRLEELEGESRSNAGVYVHIILPLPADLSPRGRAGLLKELIGHYDRLNLPFSAALHKPDPSGSNRNYHAHILLSLRSMTRHDDRLEFALTKQTWLNTTAGLMLQRRIIASAFNRALAAERIATRWTHRSRVSDGLAPGGFTKRKGVRNVAPAASRSEQAVDASSQRLDLLGLAGRALDQVERLAAGFAAIATRMETIVAPYRAAQAGAIASSQPEREDQWVRSIDRAASPEVGKPDDAVASSQPAPASAQPAPPAPPSRGKVMAAMRRKLRETPEYAGLDEAQRISLDAEVNWIEKAVLARRIDVERRGNDFHAFVANSAVAQRIDALATGTLGERILTFIASYVAPLADRSALTEHVVDDGSLERLFRAAAERGGTGR